jgi:hypothetical protein
MTRIKSAVGVANTTLHSAEPLKTIFSPTLSFLLLGSVEDAELLSNWSFYFFHFDKF